MPEKLLYISQVIPEPTGSGLAMRAYHVLKALASRYSIHLLVIGRSIRGKSIPSDLSIREMQYLPAAPLLDRDLLLRLILYKLRPASFVSHFSQPMEWAFISKRRIQMASRAFEGLHFDVLHAFRLYTAPFAEAFFQRSNFQQLDLDDIDSETRHGISRLCSANEEPQEAARNAREAHLYEEIARTTLPKWKRVFVCSSLDKNKLVDMYGHPDVHVLPNVVSLPGSVIRKQPDEIFRFLFVGNFYYYPNQDAILFLSKQILPVLRKMMGCRFAICLAGAGLSSKLRRVLHQVPEMEAAGYVTDLGEVYKTSNAAIVPIRAGGGTRTKVLEAFSFQTPVISTTTGIYGIVAQDEEHCLVGDTPETFARQCVRISREPELRASLTRNALDLVQNFYSPQSLINRCASL